SASSDAFCSSRVLMLICMKFWLIASQFSITRNSPIFLSISLGSSAANIAIGLGNGAGAPVGGVKPGTGTPNGFHIFCRNSRACCGDKGIEEESATFSLLLPGWHLEPGWHFDQGSSTPFGCTLFRYYYALYDGNRCFSPACAEDHCRRGQRSHR